MFKVILSFSYLLFLIPSNFGGQAVREHPWFGGLSDKNLSLFQFFRSVPKSESLGEIQLIGLNAFLTKGESGLGSNISELNPELNQEVLELKTLVGNYRLMVVGLVILLVIMTLVVVVVTKRQHKNYLSHQASLALEKDQLGAEKSEIESELKEAAAQLYAFTMSIWEKNKQIETYTEELKKHSGLSELYYKHDHENIMQQLMQATLLTDEQWDGFRQLFDKVYPGFQFRLSEQLPGLSPAETRYLLLRKLNLSNKEMAAMLGVGSDSVRQYRSRLRRKYNFTEEERLEELIASIRKLV